MIRANVDGGVSLLRAGSDAARMINPVPTCPTCSQKIALRVTAHLMESVAAAAVPPETPMISFKCKNCRNLTVITAEAILRGARGGGSRGDPCDDGGRA